jgi:hypothetical protein
MVIVKRIKFGILKGYTIRKSKHDWYALYSSNGVSQTHEKHTLEEINEIVKLKQQK